MLTQKANDTLAVLGVVRGGARITVDEAILDTRIASLRAVAVIALALPTRTAKRR